MSTYDYDEWSPREESVMSESTVNCAVECTNGCVLGEDCPNQEYRKAASKFIQEKSMDDILKIAEDSLVERLTRSPNFTLPEVPQWPES